MIGARVSHYRILEKIGEGGMGEVYLAEDEKLRRKVALKFLPADLTRDEARRERFIQEARAAAAIEHPHIAAIHDIDEAEGRTFIAMEHVEGRSLRECIRAETLGLRKTVDFAVQIGDGLAKAHEHGVVHRDIKPENVLVSVDGYAKIIDFGLAKLLEPLTAALGDSSQAPTEARFETREGLILGTVAYMSPEQARGERVDARSDIFSLGAVLYEMITGKSPFRRATVVETLNAVLKDTPPPARESLETPYELERILRKSLAKHKDERYQSMKDLVLDLREVRDQLAGGARPLAVERKRPKRWPLWAAATAFVLGLVLTAFSLFRRDAAPPGIGASGRPAIAVMYFENNTGDEQIRWLSRGLPSMLLTDLAQTPGLDVVSSQRVHEILKQIGRESVEAIDKGLVSEVARRSGAGAVVVGSIFKSGAEIRIDVQVEDVGSGRILTAQSVRGSDVFPLVEELTGRIRASLRMADAPVGPPLTEVTTASLEAYRHYTEGLEARRNLRYADARELFEKAVKVDPSFAMAYFELSLIAGRLRQTELEETHLEKVLQNLNRLPERQKLLLQALDARQREGNPQKAAEILESLIDKYPDEEDAYIGLARVYVELGRPEARLATLRRGVAALPQSGPLHNDYGYALLREGSFQDALRQFEAYARLRPDEPNPYDSIAETYLVLGETEKALQSYTRALEVDPNFLGSHGGRAWAYAMMGRYDRVLAEAEKFQALASGLNIPLTTHHFMQAFTLSRLGRYAEAEEERRLGLELAAKLKDQQGVVGFYLLDAFLALERGNAQKALERAHGAERLLASVTPPMVRQAQTMVTDTLAGIAAARSGRMEEARGRLDRARELRDTRSAVAHTWWYYALAGEIHLKEGRLQEAEADYSEGTAQVKRQVNLGTPEPSVLVQHYPFRDGLARIRKARGDLKGAIEAYRDLNTPGPQNKWTAWLEPRFVLETARLLDQMGDRQGARAEYQRFFQLWGDADPDLAELKEARQYLR